MSRRSFVLAVAIFLCLTCGVGAALWMLVRYEPGFYLQAALPPGNDRHKLSEDCQRELSQLWYSVTNQDEQKWGHRFTDQQINSWLAEHFVSSRLDVEFLPEGIRQPRIVIEPDRFRVAFRYGRGLWSTVVSIDLCPWLVKGEPNVIAFKLMGFHAGALPISSQSLLESINEKCQGHGIGIDWYRDGGYPVALIRFQNEQPHPALVLELIKLEQGTLLIQGHTKDPASLRASRLPSLAGRSPSDPRRIRRSNIPPLVAPSTERPAIVRRPDERRCDPLPAFAKRMCRSLDAPLVRVRR